MRATHFFHPDVILSKKAEAMIDRFKNWTTSADGKKQILETLAKNDYEVLVALKTKINSMLESNSNPDFDKLRALLSVVEESMALQTVTSPVFERKKSVIIDKSKLTIDYILSKFQTGKGGDIDKKFMQGLEENCIEVLISIHDELEMRIQQSDNDGCETQHISTLRTALKTVNICICNKPVTTKTMERLSKNI